MMLSDIFPTGWHATELAGLRPGESCVVYGAGPVGQMAAYSALLKGASKVMVVDRQADRLKVAESIGCIPIDDSRGRRSSRSSISPLVRAPTGVVSAWATRRTTRRATSTPTRR